MNTIAGTGATPGYVKVLRKDPCCYCGMPPKVLKIHGKKGPSGPVSTVDHIYPYRRSRVRTGDNKLPETGFSKKHWSNLTAACASCNSRKGTESVLLFLHALHKADERAAVRAMRRATARKRKHTAEIDNRPGVMVESENRKTAGPETVPTVRNWRVRCREFLRNGLTSILMWLHRSS